MRFAICAAAAAVVAMPVAAQEEELSQAESTSAEITKTAIPASATVAPVPVQAIAAAPRPATFLPAGTEIPLKLTETVTTKGKSWKEGDQFNLNVATNVMLGNYVVIPQGTKAKGRITWLTSRGAFGKSGKMDVELEYLEMAGRRINLDGTFRQEGDGATLATVGGVVLAGPFAGFITGKSGVIPQGRELLATLESDLPVALPEGASAAPAPVQATAVAAPAVSASETPEKAPENEQASAEGAAPEATDAASAEVQFVSNPIVEGEEGGGAEGDSDSSVE